MVEGVCLGCFPYRSLVVIRAATQATGGRGGRAVGNPRTSTISSFFNMLLHTTNSEKKPLKAFDLTQIYVGRTGEKIAIAKRKMTSKFRFEVQESIMKRASSD